MRDRHSEVPAARDARSQNGFPKPYEGVGQYYLEDEVVAAVHKAIQDRDKTQTALRIARADESVE